MDANQFRGVDSLPPVLLQRQIANAVHKAIVDMRAANGIHESFLYAYVGVIVASVFVRRHYEVMAGTLRIRAAGGNDCLLLGGSDEPRQGGTYHAWFHALHSKGRVEVVDLSARHYRVLAERRGRAWSGEEPPRYLWDWADALPSAMSFGADAGALSYAHVWYHDWRHLVHDLARCAVRFVRLPPLAWASPLWQRRAKSRSDVV